MPWGIYPFWLIPFGRLCTLLQLLIETLNDYGNDL